MKKHLFRLLTLLCVFAFIVTAVPVTVSAEELTAALTKTDSNISTEADSGEIFEESAIIGEITDMREENVKYFRRDDGMIVAAMYDKAVHYQDGDEWKEIDNTLVAEETRDGVTYYKNTANKLQVRMPDRLNTNTPITVQNGEYTLQWTLQSGQSKSTQITPVHTSQKETTTLTTTSSNIAVVKNQKELNEQKMTVEKLGSSVVYDRVYDNVLFHYDVVGDKFKESIILAKPTNQTEFSFLIQAQGLTAQLQEDGSVRFFAPKTEEPVFVIASPYMFDSNHEYSQDVTVQLTSVKGGYRYVLTPSQTWLQAEERQYPVTIDPTVSLSDEVTSFQTAEIYSGRPNKWYGGEELSYVGTYMSGEDSNYYECRTLLKAALLENMPTGSARVVDASLRLIAYTHNNGHGEATQINAHRVMSDWTENTVTWNTSPSFDPTVVDYVSVDSGLKLYTINVTRIVNEWISGADNFGLLLKVPSLQDDYNDHVSWFTEEEDDYSPPVSPSMVITYRELSGLENYWTYTTTAVGRGVSASVNNANGALTVVAPIIGVNGNIMPVSISHVYNSTNAFSALQDGKWRTNYHIDIEETIEETVEETEEESRAPDYCTFTDGDGTPHFMCPVKSSLDEGEQGSILFKDIDGLGLTLTINEASTDARYVVTDLGDNVMEFNQHGNLVCLRNTNDHTITVTYNNNTSVQKISRITDGAGRHYTFTYSSGHLASITDPASRVTSFTYINSHELARITYPDGEYTDFSYENRELRRISGDGQRIVIEYDSVLPTKVTSMTLTNPSETTDINRFEFTYHQNATTIKDVSCDEAESDILATYQFNEYGHTVCVLNENDGSAQSFKFGKPGNANTGEENQLLTSSDLKQSVLNLVNQGRLDDDDCLTVHNGFTVLKSSGVNATVGYDPTKGHTANGSILVDCSSAPLNSQQNIYAVQRYDIKEAGYYTLSTFINTNGSLFLDGYGAVIRLERWSYQDVLLSSSQSTVDYTPETEWFQAGTSLYCEPNDTLQILLGTSGEGMNEQIWFDDVQLEKDIESINEFNLLEYSDIGANINHWEKTNTIWAYPTKMETVGGISLHPVVAVGEITSEAHMKQTVPIRNGQPGDAFSMGAWAKGETAPLAGHEDRIYGVRLDFNNQDRTTTTRRISFNSAYTEWQFVSGEAVADKPYDSVTFYIEYDRNVNDAYFALPFLYRDNFGHSYTYDKDGNVISATDQENSQTAYAYNDQQLSSLAAPTGTKQFVSSNDDTHNAESVLTTNGQRYEYQYDSNGNLTNTTVGVENFATTLESGHIYYIRNAYSGNALDSAGLTAGDAFHNWRWIKNNSMQKFTLVSTGEADVYIIQSSDAPHLRMEVNTDNEGDYPNFILSDVVGENNEISILQHFKITSNDNGTFSIFTKTSGYESCVDGQPGDATDASNATPIGQQTALRDENDKVIDAGQQWYFIEYGVISEEETPEDTLIDDLYMTSSATYTPDGNYLASTTDAFGETTTYNINSLTGNTESVTAPNNVVTSYSYDDSGIHNTRVGVKTTTNAPLGSVDYTYDGDRLTGIETYTGQQYSFVYDEFGRTTSVWVGEAGTGRRLARYEYTPGQGLLSRLIYGNGNYVNYAYDDLGRQIKAWYGNNTATGYETVYNSRGLVGLLKDLTADTNTRYWYDLAGRLTHIRQESTSLGYRITEAYYHFEDGTNRLLQDRIYVQTGQELGDLFGSVTDYTYGDIAAGEMPDSIYSIAQNGVTEVEYTYDELGRIVQRKLPVPNVHQNYYYTNPYSDTNHTTNQVKMITSYNEGYMYDYDEAGNIIQVSKDDELSESYSYDPLGQLLSANIDGTEYRYSYDKNGNILTSLEGPHYNTYEYAPYSNMPWKDQLVTYNNQTITYDAIGNPLTYRDGMSFTWQNGRQLASTTKNGVTTAYTYNGDGTRSSKTVDNTTTQYYYVNGRLQALTKDIYTAFFLYDDTGRPYAIRLTILPEGHTYPMYVMAYYKYNLQGDVVGLYNTSGQEFVTYTYDPWGKPLSATGISPLLIANPFRYRGYVYDDETGLYYCNSRYYDPETGRWINADGLVSTGQGVLGYNMYAYCNNNPIIYSDVNGCYCTRDTHTTSLNHSLSDLDGDDALRAYVTGSSYRNVEMSAGTPNQEEMNPVDKWKEKGVEFEPDEKGNGGTIKNSYLIDSAYDRTAYVMYLMYESDYKSNFSGSIEGFVFEWDVHNLAYHYYTRTGDTKKADQARDLNVGRTIYEDDDHGVSGYMMLRLYEFLYPNQALDDHMKHCSLIKQQ